MLEKIEIDHNRLLEDLIKLCKTPGPTQACVKVSGSDPRIEGDFPMEEKIKEVIRDINKELNKENQLQIIRHMGNLIIVGGLERLTQSKEKGDIIDAQELSDNEFKLIRDIPVIFGAHLDEITYIVSREREDINQNIWEIFPLCNPPKRVSKIIPICKERKEKGKIDLLIGKVLKPKCEIVGYRLRKLVDIDSGELMKVYKTKKPMLLEDGQIIVEDEEEKREIGKIDELDVEEIDKILMKYALSEDFLLLNVEKGGDVREGDMVIQNYGKWDIKEGITPDYIFEAKALDDRVGCISVIYAVKELVKRGIPSKAILTSSEEGVPHDVSWGRLVQPSYEKFCKDCVVTLICDGMDGEQLERINRYYSRREVEDLKDKRERGEKLEELKEAVIIPYTSNGKGGGDAGIFSLIRDEVIPKLSGIYPESIAVTSTDYSSRSFEVKIMDRWTLIGFVQWTCGTPQDKTMSICHNRETVRISQIINIIRTLAHSAACIHYLCSNTPNRLFH